MEEAPKERVAVMAKISDATFPSMVSRMVKKGLIKYGEYPGTLVLTEEGMALAEPSDDIATSNEEVHEGIKKDLKGKPRQIFEILADGKVHNKEDIMKQINCTNKATFAPLLSRELKKKGLIQYPSKGTVQLSDMCFPFGRN